MHKGVYLTCYLALKGALTSNCPYWKEKQYKHDFDFVYHGCYTFVAVLGLTLHPFFYPFLVRLNSYSGKINRLIYSNIPFFDSYSMSFTEMRR